MNRRQLLENLREEDPDVVVDLLGITTDELISRFRVYVNLYLDEESDDEQELNDD